MAEASHLRKSCSCELQGIVREYGEEAEEGNLLEQPGREKLLY